MQNRIWLFSVLLLSIAGALTSSGIDYTWDGGDGPWETSTNWDPVGVPGPDDTATLGSSDTVTLTSDTSVAQLHLDGALLSPVGHLSTAFFEWTAGRILGGGGSVTVTSGGTLSITGAGLKQISGTLNNEGNGTWNDGPINYSGSAEINNSGMLTILNDQDFRANGSGSAAFNNSGTLKKGSGDAAGSTEIGTSSGTSAIPFAFNNTGTAEVNAGNLELHAYDTTAVHTGSFSVVSGSELPFFAGNGGHSFESVPSISEAGTAQATASIDNAGQVQFGRGTTTWNGTYSGDGTLLIDDGSSNPNVLIETDTTIAHVVHDRGTLQGTADVTITTLDWTGGTIAGAGKKIISDDLNLFGGTKTFNTSGGIIVKNRAKWTAGALTYSSNGLLVNEGTFRIQTDADFSPGSSGNPGVVFNNTDTGTIIKEMSTGETIIGKSSGTSAIPYAFNNDGTVQVLTGELELGAKNTSPSHNGMFEVASGATLRFQSAGSGEQRLEPDSSISNEGTVEIGSGEVNMQGGYTGTGRLLMSTSSSIFETDVETTVHQLDFNAGRTRGTNSLIVAGTLNFDTTSTKNVQNVIRNEGTAHWRSGTLLSIGSIDNAGTFNIALPTTQSMSVGFNNMMNAKLVKSGTGRADFNDPFTNAGQIQVNESFLQFDGEFTQTMGSTELLGGSIDGSDTLELQGGTLLGAGLVDNNVNNTGATVIPGTSTGILMFGGNYTQTAGGSLEIEIGGINAGHEPRSDSGRRYGDVERHAGAHAYRFFPSPERASFPNPHRQLSLRSLFERDRRLGQ